MNEYLKLFKTKRFVGSQPITFDSKTYSKKLEYFVTHKLDGLRKLLMITNTHTFLISSKMDFDIYNIPYRESLNSTVLDGEFVNGYFYAFDILVFKGKDVRPLLLTERLELLKETVKLLKSKKVLQKEYLTSNLCKDFFTLKEKYSKEMKTGEVDGIILTANTSYTAHPPLKWKPIWLLSIDFKIHSIKDGVIHLLTQNGEVFKPKGKYSYVGTVKLDNKDVNKYNTGDVVEFIFEKGKFVPIRLRKDKTNSNHLRVILSNFNSILYPPNVKKILC